MSHALSQPEEVDQAIFEMNATEHMHLVADTEHDHTEEEKRKNWNFGYLSPYRAAHMNFLLH
jgi:hypothetical protein